jgi:hypothetical protein
LLECSSAASKRISTCTCATRKIGTNFGTYLLSQQCMFCQMRRQCPDTVVTTLVHPAGYTKPAAHTSWVHKAASHTNSVHTSPVLLQYCCTHAPDFTVHSS